VTDAERIDALESENRQLRATLLQWEAIIARHLAWGNSAYERDNPSGFRDNHPPMSEIRRLLLPQPERDLQSRENPREHDSGAQGNEEIR
jgi:hypothetical protein